MPQEYCSTQDVLDLLRDGVAIEVGQLDPTTTNAIDVSIAQVDAKRVEAEAEIEGEMSRFYSVPLLLVESRTIALLRRLATWKAAYSVYLMIHPQFTLDSIPAAVLQWAGLADEQLKRLAPEGKETLVQGRDIILNGETLLVSSGTQGAAAFAMTRGLPYGGSE
jgi:hypothetical protein